MEPAAFRRLLNTTIQELRNVSWLVQKQKAALPGYEDWYPAWQSQAKDDRVMRWVVQSRNRVVKEGDLEIASSAIARYQSLDHRLSTRQIEIAPHFTTDRVLGALLQGHHPATGILTVRREWRDSELSDFELLGALGHAWRVCARLVKRAHGKSHAEDCFDASPGWTHSCVLPSLEFAEFVCVEQGRDYFEISLDLADGRTQQTRYIAVEHDPIASEEAAERYGEVPHFRGGDAIADVPRLVRFGRSILMVDNDLMPTVHYYKANKLVDFNGLQFEDRVSVLRSMVQMAERASELEADSLAISSEVWLATYDKTRTESWASDRPDRTEALQVQAVRSDGTARIVTVSFTRDSDGHKHFSPPEGSRGPLTVLEPFRQLWGLKRWWVLADEVALHECGE